MQNSDNDPAGLYRPKAIYHRAKKSDLASVRVTRGETTTVRSDQDGVFYPLVVPEAYVQKGMRIGYVTDYFGNKLTDVTSPSSGVVVYICWVPSIKKGDAAACIGEIAGVS